MINLEQAKQDQKNWLAEQVSGIKTEHHVKLVSEWAETTRYLPPSVTSKPGMYNYDVCPYLREIVDCLSSESPVREVDMMKGAQICATVGVLESTIGYYIEHENNCPMMLVTADKELADLRIDKYIVPMLENSNLAHLIQANDTLSKGKSGRTKDQLSWAGGGFLIPFGANSSNKLRSTSIKILLLDEIDGFKVRVGKDGDPIRLVKTRTEAYEHSRKIMKLSTPTIKGASNIESHFMKGDQRKYYVPCKHCGTMQILKFSGTKRDTGEAYGLIYETDGGVLVPESVRYVCEHCGGQHVEADKVDMLAKGEWRPTAKSTEPTRRSYQISALYSPYGFKSWRSCVQDWLEAWDIMNNKPKDVESLQVFYNNVLGETFRPPTEELDVGKLSKHRRKEYRLGELPNTLAIQSCDSEILLVTMAVDVHKDNLRVATYGWTEKHRAFLLDYWKLHGDCLNVGSQPWIDLKSIIINKRYTDNHGRTYPIALTLIDARYGQHVVLEFCSETDGTLPIYGFDRSQKDASVSQFKMGISKLGTQALNINVNFYKDRWYSALKRPWIESQKMHEYCYNIPVDLSNDILRELTAESRDPDIDPVTKNLRGFKWIRKGENEMWDLLVYNNAAVDVIAWDLIVRQGERQDVHWDDFWEFCRTGDGGRPYFYEG